MTEDWVCAAVRIALLTEWLSAEQCRLVLSLEFEIFPLLILCQTKPVVSPSRSSSTRISPKSAWICIRAVREPKIGLVTGTHLLQVSACVESCVE